MEEYKEINDRMLTLLEHLTLLMQYMQIVLFQIS